MALSQIIGNIGEVYVVQFLNNHDFHHIFVFQNAKGNGLDIIALKKYRDTAGNLRRYVLSIEVKATTTRGSGPPLSVKQKNPNLYVGEVLAEAFAGEGRFGALGTTFRRSAGVLLAAIASGVPHIPVHVRLQIKLGGQIVGHALKRVRIHAWTAKATRPVFDKKF